MKAMLIAQNPRSSKTLTLQGVLYSQYFRNKAIVLCKTTNEYCCQSAEPRLWPNCSKGFKSIQVTFLLHQITRQDCLWACDGV